MSKLLWVIVVLVVALQILCGRSGAKPIQAALNSLGEPTSPFNPTNAATVLVFVAVDCPISNRYAPEVERLSKRFAPLGIPFWIVYPDKDTSLATIRKHAREFRLGDHLLWDTQHTLVKAAHVQTTPEVAVFARPQRLVYHGQIDDRFVALGMERPAATRHYLEETLRAILDHKPVLTNQTQAIGCSIPD